MLRHRVGLAAVALAWLAARGGIELVRFATAAPELPLWDEAKYGLDGARLAAALGSFDLPRFAALVYDLDVWPPLFPLAESLVFLAAGNGFSVARGFVAVLFVLLVLATFWAAREIAPESTAVGALASLLVLVSPFVQLFGAQAMLEVPGALLYALALAAYAGYLRTGARPWIVATGALSAALFFTKYNYGLLWLAALAASECWIACGGARAALARAAAAARRIDLRRPFTAFVALYLVVLGAIWATGGGTLRLGDAALSMRSIGNPLLLLVAIVVARLVWRPRRRWTSFRQWERALAERHRVLLWTVAAPIAIWLLLPPHLRGFVDFVENRSSGPPVASVAGLLFYPRVFVEQYHAQPWLGWAVLASALAALARIGVAAPAARALLLAAGIALSALTLHPYKEPRFLLIAAPALWLAAAWNVVTWIEAAVGTRGGGAADRRLARLLVNGGLTLAALVAVARGPALAPTLRESFARYAISAAAAPMLDRVIETAARNPTLVLGTWNQVSPALVEWRFLQRHPPAAAAPPTAPEVVVPSRRGGSAERLMRRLREGDAPIQVVTLDVDTGTAPTEEWAAAFATETSWLDPLRRELEAGALAYRESLEESWAGAGYRLRVYRRDAP